MEDNEKLADFSLHPYCSINVADIVADWYKEWGETEETNTVSWELVAMPLLPGGKLALLFEHTAYRYYSNARKELMKAPVSSYYRVLVFDVLQCKFLCKYRFSLQGYASTVYFREDKLFAVISPHGQESYTAMQMKPDDDNYFLVGNDISSHVPLADGSLVISYREGEDALVRYFPEGKAQPVTLLENMRLMDVNVDYDGRIWGVQDNGKTLVLSDGDKLLLMDLPFENAHTVAVPRDPGELYLVLNFGNGDYVLYKKGNPREGGAGQDGYCQLETSRGTLYLFERASSYEGLLALQQDGWIYVVDTNGQE